jgi:hypothetical protein
MSPELFWDAKRRMSPEFVLGREAEDVAGVVLATFNLYLKLLERPRYDRRP